MSRPYWDLVQTFPTLRSFITARLLQEVDAGNRQAISAYNDVLGYLDEQDRQQGEDMAREADRLRSMRCSDYAVEHQAIRDGEFDRLSGNPLPCGCALPAEDDGA